MKIHYSFDIPEKIKNPVITTGTFDGVHVGHLAIIRRLNKLAQTVDGESVLITFHPHPRRVLYPESAGKDLLLICSQEEKQMLLRETGLDHLIIIEFTPEFAKITSNEFVEKLLVEKLNARMVVIGFNHQFGYNREGDFSFLYRLGRKFGFEVEEIPEQDIHNESVSSTKIRKALLEGNIQRANAYLDHYYVIHGKLGLNVERSNLFGRSVFNLGMKEWVKLIPPDGVYAVNVKSNSTLRKGLFSVANHSVENSLMSKHTEMELCPLDQNSLEAGDEVVVYFHKKIRNGRNNMDQDRMRTMISKDLKAITELIY